MGLIKAGVGALGGTLADQWKEFFCCEAIPKEVLVTKGQKRVSGRSSNTRGERQHHLERLGHCRGRRAVYDNCGAGQGC